ncbi:uncharacterized protein PD653B2_0338 [Nocardioides sp. PD653-B2]|nr:uncharacterized protein PD653B2_0338 [Nocardioides sp. PD653-B2]
MTASGRWARWQSIDPRLEGFASLEDVHDAWRRREARCYLVVAGLTALGSRRGGDDDDAALAVTALLDPGAQRVATSLRDVCEVDDVRAAVWEAVKAAEPQLGPCAARYLLQRARQQLSRPGGGMVARVPATSLEQWLGGTGVDGQRRGDWGEPLADRDAVIASPPVEDPVTDLVDLLTWARDVGEIDADGIDLLVELLAAENGGLPREEAQRIAGERRGVAMRTVRRRRDSTVARLRAAIPRYLAATA